jgi:hypothetical protein
MASGSPEPFGAVVGEHRQRVEPERFLPRRRSLLFLRARGHDRRVDIDQDRAGASSWGV